MRFFPSFPFFSNSLNSGRVITLSISLYPYSPTLGLYDSNPVATSIDPTLISFSESGELSPLLVSCSLILKSPIFPLHSFIFVFVRRVIFSSFFTSAFNLSTISPPFTLPGKIFPRDASFPPISPSLSIRYTVSPIFESAMDALIPATPAPMTATDF